MALDFMLQHEIELVLITVTGELRQPEAQATIERVALSGAWHYAVIWDYRDGRLQLSAAEVQQLASQVRSLSRTYGPRGPIAVIAESDPDYGIGRMGAMYAEAAGYRVEVFRALGPALAWMRGQRQQPQES